MGYCFMTGKLKSGRITFTKCDGRSSVCIIDYHTSYSDCKRKKKRNPDLTFTPNGASRCSGCLEYAQTYKLALILFRDWLINLEDPEINQNTKTCISWAKSGIGDFGRIK